MSFKNVRLQANHPPLWGPISTDDWMTTLHSRWRLARIKEITHANVWFLDKTDGSSHQCFSLTELRGGGWEIAMYSDDLNSDVLNKLKAQEGGLDAEYLLYDKYSVEKYIAVLLRDRMED